jgi:cytochrome c biogenesis protein CcdA
MRACLLFLLALLLPQQVQGLSFEIPPYLMQVSTDEAVVAFRLDQDAPAELHILDGTERRVVKSDASQAMHFIPVDNLAHGTVYPYEIHVDGGQVFAADFQELRIGTAVKPGESFVFAVYGDPRPGDTETTEHYETVLDQVILAEPSFTLLLGDMVDDGSKDEEWQRFFEVSSPLFGKSAVFPVKGDNDHSLGKACVECYFPILETPYYSFDWGGVQFFALDAWGTRSGQDRKEYDAESRQVRWLEEQLAREEVQKAPFRVVFLHDPVYISRGRAADVLTRSLKPLFEKYRVDVVFSSWHLYERSTVNGVTYIVSGGAGAEIISMPPNPAKPSQAEALRHHYTKVDVHADAMTIRAVADDGTVLDEYVLTPRSDDADSIEALKRTAARLRREIVFNQSPDTQTLEVSLFSFDCSYCRRLLNKELPELAQAKDLSLLVHYYDLDIEGNYELLLNAGAKFGRQNMDLPAIFLGNVVLGGKKEIQEGLPGQVDAFLANSISYRQGAIPLFDTAFDTKDIGEEAFNALTLGIVMAAGLLDGVNPCAFTTIVFLVSYLTLFGAGTRKIVVTGLIFTSAVFLTYFLMGLLFHTALRSILVNPSLAAGVNLALLLLVVVLGLLSLVDFLRFAGGHADSAIVKIPENFRLRMERAIRKSADNPTVSVIAPFFLGVLVSGMELTCTGQVYIPIVAMISEPAHRVHAISYLLAYNAAFITPLLIVFGLALAGTGLGRFSKSRAFKAAVKLLTALFFVAMAGVLIYNLGWI